MIPSFTSRPARRAVCSNPRRKLLTPVAERLSAMDMVVDKMHFRNHVDRWCKETCNPYDRPDLEGVGICYYWISLSTITTIPVWSYALLLNFNKVHLSSYKENLISAIQC